MLCGQGGCSALFSFYQRSFESPWPFYAIRPSLPILTSGNQAFTFTQLPPAGYFLLWPPTKSVSLLSDADFELESVVYLMSTILIALSCSQRDRRRPVIWVNLSWQSIAEMFRWSKHLKMLLKMMLNLIKTQKTKKTKKKFKTLILKIYFLIKLFDLSPTRLFILVLGL